MLRVGISEVDITPAPGRRVAGMLNPPKAEGAVWPLFGRSFVFAGPETTIAILVLDNLMLAPALVAGFRAAVTQGTDLVPENVMITCTHTHRAPFAAALMDEEIDFEYVNWMQARLAQGLRSALAALQPARLRSAHIQAPGWTFNRRQVYRSERYGEQVGTQGPQQHPDFLRNEGPEDNELKALMVESEDGTCLGGLVNFACHTTVMGGEPVYSADYAGALTEALSKRYGGVFGFLQGAAGNLWAMDTSKFMGQLDRDYMGPEHNLRMGTALAEKTVRALETGQPVPDGRVSTARKVLSIPQRRVTRAQVELAQGYLEHPQPGLDQREFTRQIYGHDFTFFNNDPVVQQWFARETIGMWEWQRRTGTPELCEAVEVQVMVLGDIAFVGLPGEIFTEFGLQVKAQSPFRETFVVELANGWHGYIPTREAFEHGGYEPRLGYTSRLIPEAGERMVSVALELLGPSHSS
jgi:neutral ceramidase